MPSKIGSTLKGKGVLLDEQIPSKMTQLSRQGKIKIEESLSLKCIRSSDSEDPKHFVRFGPAILYTCHFAIKALQALHDAPPLR